jgi:hypothetical protein
MHIRWTIPNPTLGTALRALGCYAAAVLWTSGAAMPAWLVLALTFWSALSQPRKLKREVLEP